MLDLCKHKEESIRSVVAENIGKLFVVHSDMILTDIEQGLKDSNPLVRSTIARSFKYSGVRELDQM